MEPTPPIEEPAFLYLPTPINDEKIHFLYASIMHIIGDDLLPCKIRTEPPLDRSPPICYPIPQKLAHTIVSLEANGRYLESSSSNHRCKKIGNVWFKANNDNVPLKPGMEAAMYFFYKLFVGPYIAPSCLILLTNIQFEKASKSEEVTSTQIVQASLGVEGITFYDFIQNRYSENPKTLRFDDLNTRAVSAFYVASLLTNPADYKAKNLIVEHGTNALIGIDNDDALAPSLCLTHNNVTLKDRHHAGVKQILYCIDELMEAYVDDNIRKLLVTTDIRKKLIEWLRLLKEYNEKHAYVSTLLSSHQVNELGLPLKLPRGTIKHICTTFNTIQSKLNDSPDCKHRELMLTAQPLLTQYYMNVAKRGQKDPKDKEIVPCLITYNNVNTSYEVNNLENILDLRAQ